MSLEYYAYYLYYTFLGYPFVIRVAIVAICIYSPFFIYAIYKLTHTRNLYYKKRKLREKLAKEYGDKIKEIITSEKRFSREEIEGELTPKLKKKSNLKKRILTNIILSLKNRSDYINRENCQKVVESLELRQFWEGKLKYGKLASKQRALRKLDDLDIEIPGSVITSLTYNRNQYLRKRARSSYMYFSKNNPYKFFDEDFDNTFNEWDKVEIHRILSRKAGEKLPNLSQWIRNSRNSDFKCFLVDEISHFEQHECAPFLMELVTTVDDTLLSKHCIDALGELNYLQAEDELIREYPLQPQIIQQSIIKAIQHFKSGKSLAFLKGAYHNASDVESRKIILNAIYHYGENGQKLFESLKTISSGFPRSLFDHVSNPLIKYI